MRRLAGDDPQVNEEWISDKDRFAFNYATTGDQLTHPLIREDGEGCGRRTAGSADLRGREAERPRGTDRADRRPAHPRGRLRVLEVRRVARHQRHRLRRRTPRRRRTSSPPRWPAPVWVRRSATWRRRIGAARRVRARGGGAVGVPAAPQGRPRARHQGLHGRGLRFPRDREARRCRRTASPGTEAAVLADLGNAGETGAAARRSVPDSIIIVGERLASVPGGYSTALRLALDPGAQLAWIPRRAG